MADVRVITGAPTGASRRTIPGAPVKRQPIVGGRPTIDPIEINAQQHQQELQGVQQRFDQAWQELRRMERVVGFEKTQKLAADLRVKASQEALKLKQQFELKQNTLAQIGTLFSKQPDVAKKHQIRAVLGAAAAEDMFPDKLTPDEEFDRLLLRRNRVTSVLGRTDYRNVRQEKSVPISRKDRLLRSIRFGGLTAIPAAFQGAEAKALVQFPEIWDPDGGKDHKGGWRPATFAEQQTRKSLLDEVEEIDRQLAGIDVRQTPQSSLSRVAASKRPDAGTFAQKVQLSDKNLRPQLEQRPATPSKKPNIRTATNPQTGQTLISIDGGPWQ